MLRSVRREGPTGHLFRDADSGIYANAMAWKARVGGEGREPDGSKQGAWLLWTERMKPSVFMCSVWNE